MSAEPVNLNSRLAEVKSEFVGFRCSFCGRSGDLPIKECVGRFGADVMLMTLLRAFMQRCPWSPFSPHQKPRKYGRKCGAYLALGATGEPVPRRRFPPPWRVVERVGGLKVVDANNTPIAFIECSDRPPAYSSGNKWLLTADEGRRVALWIARLPELIMSTELERMRPGAKDGSGSG